MAVVRLQERGGYVVQRRQRRHPVNYVHVRTVEVADGAGTLNLVQGGSSGTTVP
jgi:hypothetical protein